MYILRVRFTQHTRYGTAAEDGLRIRFARKTKSTGRVIRGMFREVKDDGPDRSRIDVAWRATDSPLVSDRGLKGLYPGNTHFRLLARHDHIRRVRPDDELTLAMYDREIAEVEATLKAWRDKRAEHAATAFKRAEKIPIYELEDQAQRNVPAIDQK